MERVEIYETIDTNYKKGKVECKCGHVHELGDGFNVYKVGNCPECSEVKMRNQKKVILWDKEQKSLKAEIGKSLYYVLSNGINIRHSKRVDRTVYGTERQLDKI